MSKQLTPKQWKNCFKKYESYSQSQFWNYYAKFKTNKTINQDHKKQFRNTYTAYKRGNTSIIHSMTGRKKTGRPKKKKAITWDDFTKEELIQIAKRYKEITEEKKKKDKMKETKNLNLTVFKLVFLLGISKSGYYKNRKVTYKSKRDLQLEKIIAGAFYINKKIYGWKRIAKYIEQNNNIMVSDRTIGNYLRALGLVCILDKQKEEENKKISILNMMI